MIGNFVERLMGPIGPQELKGENTGPMPLVDALAQRRARFKRDILRDAIRAGTVSTLTPPVSVERWLEEMWRLWEGERPLGMAGPRVWELPGYKAEGEKK